MRHQSLVGLAALPLVMVGCALATGLGVGNVTAVDPVTCVDEIRCDSGNGLVLAVTPSETTIAPGDRVTFDVALQNNRNRPVQYAAGMCFASLTVQAALPLEPAGREWTGKAAWFKDHALRNGFGPGGVPATDPIEVQLISDDCPEALDLDTALHPGQRVAATFHWNGSIATDLPALPGPVRYRVSIGYDRLNGPPTYPPGYTGVRGSWVALYNQLGIEGTIEVRGDAPSIVSAGQAIDAVLADGRFAGFLEAQPDGTCELVNLFIENHGGSGSARPSWEIDLFCETGVPRHFAIAYVDALTADVRRVDICAVPCER